jgi:dUTPase
MLAEKGQSKSRTGTGTGTGTGRGSRAFYELYVWFDHDIIPMDIVEKYKTDISARNAGVEAYICGGGGSVGGGGVDAGFDLYVPREISIYEGTRAEKISHGLKTAMYFNAGGGGEGDVIPTAYYLYPRSSMGSKTPLRLSNSVGIIDAGYRGYLIGMFDYLRGGYNGPKGSMNPPPNPLTQGVINRSCEPMNYPPNPLTQGVINRSCEPMNYPPNPLTEGEGFNESLGTANRREYKVKKGDRLLQICAPNLTYPIRVYVVDSLSELGQTERGDGGFGSTGR